MERDSSISSARGKSPRAGLSVQYSKVANEREARLWPSERIPQGGVFHSQKVEYSKETADLLKLLMQESKMSMMMRKQIDAHMRSGEPLPKPKTPRFSITGDPDANALEILRRARNAKRKSFDKIVASGAYDPVHYRPPPDDRVPSEKAKRQLQESMAGVRLSDPTLKPKRRPPPDMEAVSPEEIINELLDQINERAEWLAEMEELGEGKKYRDEIREQVAQRLRQIKGIEAKIALQKEGFRYLD